MYAGFTDMLMHQALYVLSRTRCLLGREQEGSHEDVVGTIVELSRALKGVALGKLK